jgi:hypothetical protein
MKRLVVMALAFCVPGLACWYPLDRQILIPGQVYSGVNSQPPGSWNAVPEESWYPGAEWWYFKANAGALITIWGERQSGHFDMAFWVLGGAFLPDSRPWSNWAHDSWAGFMQPTKISALGSTFDTSYPAFIYFADNEDPPNLAGPFGDPRAVFIAPEFGWYTVVVTNAFSGAGPPNPYRIFIEGAIHVPEPPAFALAGLGVFMLALLRRLRSN